MKTIVFEDEKWLNLTPLSYLRPVFQLHCGYSCLLGRIKKHLLDAALELQVRDYLVPLVKKAYSVPVNEQKIDDDLLLVNGRWLPKAEENLNLKEEKVHLCGDSLVYGLVKKENARKLWTGSFGDFLSALGKIIPAVQEKTIMIEYPWNLIHHNPEMLKEDFRQAGKKGREGKFSSQAVIYGPAELVYVAPEAEIHPLAILDTNSGPIYIDKKAKVFPGARIEGPCYLGEDTQIMPGANIREGNSFGPVCRIGGEVEESIFYGYSNKYHDGFIGHAYIGEFVNLGALTTNSDLKNDYSSVSVYVNGVLTDTADLKVGSFIGDHTKTSIGTLLNTGTSVGVMCNLTAGGILPKFFPSFSWYINGKIMKGFGLEPMIETARAAMSRRKRVLTPEEEAVIRHTYELTKEMRLAYIKKSRKS